ncbi:MAG: hypothetical protein EB005_04845, partial [Actinobacteria bacterium]|nr:hypothetical protein [Actinomycetota bacterium]
MAKKKSDSTTPAKTPAKSTAKSGGGKKGGGGDGNGSSQLPLSSGDSVQPIQLQDEMERSFLDYAISTIMSRALPDVRDGLKPVHRRIIWDMDQQGFRPDRPYVKCARVTGDTMARYHPHGDGAIYDALVRMAQPFSLRHPLIDFHGNYGSPDFGPAASRYTEARLHPLAMQLLADIEENTVDLMPNYDGTTEEPTVLPARFPNLLVNGSQGIAVGMATSIPPHNLGEIIDATLHLIDNPEATVKDLMKFVKGPDFPTGGLILGRDGLTEAYKTGRGSIKMRAKVAIEEGQRGQMRIVVSELPYQASCSAIAARIQELVDNDGLEGIADVNDNSAGGTTNLIITLKRDANANVVMNNLFKNTQLQSQFPVNMVALVDGVPRTLTLKDALAGYVAHQIEVITRRSQFRLDKAKERNHILEGRLKALNVIDEVIKVIRASEDANAAKEALMSKKFGFSERNLLPLQSGETIQAIIDTREFPGERYLFFVTKSGQVKKTKFDEYDSSRRDGLIALKLRPKDELVRVIETNGTDDVFMVTRGGQTIRFSEKLVRPMGRSAAGVRGMKMRGADEVVSVDVARDEASILLVTESGYGKRTQINHFARKGRGGMGMIGIKLTGKKGRVVAAFMVGLEDE